jgi:hypothetical protein
MKDTAGQKILCGKCGTGSVYLDGEWLACMMCGNRSRTVHDFKLLGKESDMGRIKGTCSNCKRADLMLEPSSQRCGTCQSSIKGVLDETERATLLAATAKRLEGQSKKPTGCHPRKRKALPGAPEAASAPTPAASKAKELKLVFNDEDETLFEGLCFIAKRLRRDPVSQAMRLLEGTIPGLISEIKSADAIRGNA